MKTFELTEYSRIFFNGTDQADKLDGHSEKEPNFYDDFYSKGGNPLRDARVYQYSRLLQDVGIFMGKQRHLDIGCGDGLFVEMCRNISATESLGIDAHAPTGKPFVIKQSLDEYIQESQKSSGKKFDVISFMDVLEHFQDPDSALQGIKPLLSKDSTLLVKVPSKDSFIYRTAKLLALIAPKLSRGTFIRMYQVHFPPPHYYYYNLTALTKLIERNEFAIVGHGYISETSLPILHKRLWGMSTAVKPFAYIALLFMQLITPRSMYDGVYIVARLKTADK